MDWLIFKIDAHYENVNAQEILQSFLPFPFSFLTFRQHFLLWLRLDHLFLGFLLLGCVFRLSSLLLRFGFSGIVLFILLFLFFLILLLVLRLRLFFLFLLCYFFLLLFFFSLVVLLNRSLLLLIINDFVLSVLVFQSAFSFLITVLPHFPNYWCDFGNLHSWIFCFDFIIDFSSIQKERSKWFFHFIFLCRSLYHWTVDLFICDEVKYEYLDKNSVYEGCIKSWINFLS